MVDAVFIEIGSKGAFELASTLGVKVDHNGFVETSKKQETNVPSIFVAEDICGPLFQLAESIGEGCIAGINAANFAKHSSDSDREKLDL